MYPKLVVSYLFAFVVGVNNLSSQTSQNAEYIAELETVQSQITNTFISCSMKRTGHLMTSGEQILIHRSVDNVATWTLIDTLFPGPDSRLIDPVLTVDDYGNYYIVFMRIEDASLSLMERTTYLDVYSSTDDGLTWQFISSPYVSAFPDYPQVISKGNGTLFLVFGDFIDSDKQNIKLMKSTDGGATWSSPTIFNYPNISTTYVGIPDISWGEDSSIQISFGSNLYKGPCYIESVDLGLTWSSHLFANQSTSLANTSVLSKIISNPTVDFFGILSHRPHSNSTTLTYHYDNGNELGTTTIGQGAYGEGILTNDNIIHIVYNELEGSTFRIKYIASDNNGLTFSNPIVLYNAPFEIGEFGEYQSLVLGNDDNFYLTFCDWADGSIAKTLVFEPLNSSTLSTPDVTSEGKGSYSIYPNPFKNVITISYPNHDKIKEIIVSTSDGKIVKKINTDFNQSQFELDLSILPNGVYIVNIKEEKRYIVRRIIKS